MTMGAESKRKYIRKKVSFSFEVTGVVRDGAQLPQLARGRAFHGLEISAGGMGFETNAPLRRGDHFSVSFELPGEQHPLRLTMQIVHVTPLPATDDPARQGLLRAGAKFDRMQPEDFTYLNNYIGATHILY